MSRLKRFIIDSSQVIPLPDGIFRIGRAPDCDLVLRSPIVSKVHVVIECREDRCTIRNEGTNGTRINGDRLLESCTLQTGDQIQAGVDILVYMEAEAPPRLSDISFRSPARPLSDDPEESIRHHAAQQGLRVSGVGRAELSRSYASKISGRISFREQSVASLATTDSVRKLSQMLRLTEVIRNCRQRDRASRIFQSLYQCFPNAAQIVFAQEDAPRSQRYRVVASHCQDPQDSAYVCQDIIHYVARQNECLLLSDQWREAPGDKARLSSLGRISIMCVPIRTSGEHPNGIVQLIGAARESEFDIRDLERLAILSQLLTIVMPLE